MLCANDSLQFVRTLFSSFFQIQIALLQNQEFFARLRIPDSLGNPCGVFTRIGILNLFGLKRRSRSTGSAFREQTER